MEIERPTIHQLGTDLLIISKIKLLQTILEPFLFFALYIVFALYDYWILAILSTVAMSFTTYGSTSHDLVHMNLGLNRKWNDLLLSFIELISMRSGHAYRLSHLNHHHQYPHKEDIEGQAAGMTFVGSLLEGFVFQFKLYFWALKRAKGQDKTIIRLEGSLILLLVVLTAISIPFTNIFWLYTCLTIAGSWIIPFVTSYLVHNPNEADELTQTKLFRGRFYAIIAFDHLYHLEHHMYPMVPHKNWVELARRLDPFFKNRNIKPKRVSVSI